jgi:hypothetical protein
MDPPPLHHQHCRAQGANMDPLHMLQHYCHARGTAWATEALRNCRAQYNFVHGQIIHSSQWCPKPTIRMLKFVSAWFELHSAFCAHSYFFPRTHEATKATILFAVKHASDLRGFLLSHHHTDLYNELSSKIPMVSFFVNLPNNFCPDQVADSTLILMLATSSFFNLFPQREVRD